MKILIFGGTRYFGRVLSLGLLNQGHDVTCVTRGRISPPSGVNHIVHDRDDALLSRKIIQQDWDYVFDQSCYQPRHLRDAVTALRGKCGGYIFTSSQAVYDFGDFVSESDYIPNDSDIVFDCDSNDFQTVKRSCESLLKEQQEVPYSILRFPVVIGLNDYTMRVSSHWEALKKGQEIQQSDQFISMIDVNSVVSALLLMLKHFKSQEIYNVAWFDPVNLNDFFAEIKRVMKDESFSSNPNSVRFPSPFMRKSQLTLNSEKWWRMTHQKYEIPLKNLLTDIWIEWLGQQKNV